LTKIFSIFILLKDNNKVPNALAVKGDWRPGAKVKKIVKSPKVNFGNSGGTAGTKTRPVLKLLLNK